LAQVAVRYERLTRRAIAGADLAMESRIALLRIAFATQQAIAAPATPATRETPTPSVARQRIRGLLPTTRTAVQMGLSILTIFAMKRAFDLPHALWAMAASTFVISSSIADTWSRGISRVGGTALGVALGLGVAILFPHDVLVVWALASLAVVIYSTALPLSYGVACGAYSFALVVTLVAEGGSSWDAASGRGIATVVGAAVGMAFSVAILPVRLRDQLADTLATLLTEAREVVARALGSATEGPERVAAADPAIEGAGLLASVAAQKAHFAGLRYEGLLSHDHDGGAGLLLRTDALVDYTMRLAGEAHFLDGAGDPSLGPALDQVRGTAQAAFDAVLARLRNEGRQPLPPDVPLLPTIHAPLESVGSDHAAATRMLLAAGMIYSSRKIIRTLADLAALLDSPGRRGTAPPRDTAP
jgi:hypothetical protein